MDQRQLPKSVGRNMEHS